MEPTQDGERAVTIRRVGGVPLLMVGYHTAPGAHLDRTATDLAASILADVPSGRLYQALVESKLAAQVFQDSNGSYEPGLQMFGAVLAKDGDGEKAKAALLRELEGLKEKPLTQAELDRAKIQAQKGVDQALAEAAAGTRLPFAVLCDGATAGSTSAGAQRSNVCRSSGPIRPR